MKLFVLVLNRVEKLNELIVEYAREGICGATILDSKGMAREIFRGPEEEVSFFNSVRKFLQSETANHHNKTIFVVIREDQEELIKKITSKVIDFTQPDTGIMFIINLDYVFGKGL